MSGLSQTVHLYTPSQHLRSTNQLLTTKPTTRTVISSRSFSLTAPTVWNSHNLLPDLQSAYRVLYSTETAVVKVLSNILRAADGGE